MKNHLSAHQANDIIAGERTEQQIARLNKIITALMDRAERSMSQQGSDFGLFQATLTLEDEVEQRTQELTEALAENKKITQSLYELTASLKDEIRQRKRAEALHAGQYQIQELITANIPLKQVLRQITAWIESHSNGGIASIVLLASDDKTISDCLAPSLPQEYAQALTGVQIGPQTGSCGTAMYFNKEVTVEDISCDPLWTNYRDLALENGLRACWSTPITATSGQVLGSFAIYYRQPQLPDADQREMVSGAVHLAGIALERARSEERIHYMAHHDALTGLPNRTQLQDRIDSAIEMARRHTSHTAVLMIDLDRFKHVNDSLGHHAGDEILKEVAERLAECVRDSDTIARLGGDEFVINLPDIEHDYSASMVASNILQQLEKPFFIRKQQLQLGASIGISMYPEDGDNADDLLRTADTAMYAAKQTGRGQYCYFTEELNKAAHEHIVLLSQLQQAIKNHEFCLYYQPLYRLSDDRLVGAEALLRWQHPQRGLLAPGHFLYMLEEHGLMADVGSWVLQQGCAQMATWLQHGHSNIRLSINLAADQFYRGNLVAEVEDALRRNKLAAEHIVLEFTETVLLRNSESIIATMKALKMMGVKMSLDDFGTGYSSLSYLHSFPVDQLKIDRSFIQATNEKKITLDIVTSIVRLAQSLGIQSVAEGLETPEQKALMKQLNCDYGQGYMLGRPMSAENFSRLLNGDRPMAIHKNDG
ncbi:bifunctional diguanylate cyclase/phosphodiesterase [Lacimicrobium alkaliphilum]|uniref:Bifunctional diguanylate cyclase/phosphodiesterase n=1 Tax=Lacimicrobium alkaliphilum TaxID=1526571 RepID=A0ABQ1RU78_9ALTE|nr:EAL domain-containing protein [Lacimicrobium alkaliphilum]GGD78941.1 bifunctional diguanylate cyclase/phosphodiesterase [Lacimicrobium alkaliphilum]